MIKIYQNGPEFYQENKDFLLTNIYTEVFFRLNSETMYEMNKEEYCLKIEVDNKRLLALRKKPWSTLLYGDASIVAHLADFIIENDYTISNFLTPIETGNPFVDELNKRGRKINLKIAMDFMECKEKKFPTSDLVTVATEEDTDELYELHLAFVKECGLQDEIIYDHIKKTIKKFRVIRLDNKIVAMAKVVDGSEIDKKITNVYTRPAYRGRGYAKMLTATLVNDIIDQGFIATLNVDQANPISYHVYESIGFKKVFTQGIYYEVE